MARSAKPSFAGSNPARASSFCYNTSVSKPKTYYLHTLGCQMNKNDSERIAGDYQARGYQPTDNWQEANEIVINTCSVRKSAEDRARALLHKIDQFFKKQALSIQAKKPTLVLSKQKHSVGEQSSTKKVRPKIILTGCMLHLGEAKIKQALPMIDQVLAIGEVGFNYPAIRTDKHHAFVPISSGCNSFCSYCIVPYARGREKSRLMSEILQEIEQLIDQGYQEITLLGQNVNSWGLEKVGVSLRKMLMHDPNFSKQNLPNNQSQYLKPQGTPPFVELLRAVCKYPQIKVVRFLSANPWDFHDELIAEIANNQKIDRYVHLPIQSGSDSVLQRMNRGYTSQDYLRIVKKLHQADKKIVFGTDIIVGFPDETDDEFAQTVAVAKKVNWQVAFVAMYSPRPGTASDRLYQDNVPHAIKKKRWQILEELINRKHLSNRPKVV